MYYVLCTMYRRSYSGSSICWEKLRPIGLWLEKSWYIFCFSVSFHFIFQLDLLTINWFLTTLRKFQFFSQLHERPTFNSRLDCWWWWLFATINKRQSCCQPDSPSPSVVFIGSYQGRSRSQRWSVMVRCSVATEPSLCFFMTYRAVEREIHTS